MENKNQIIVNRNEISFVNKTNKYGPFFNQPEFKIAIDDIRVIALKVGVFFDDDYRVVILIDKSKKEYHLHINMFTSENIGQINTIFNILIEKEYDLFTHFDIDNFASKVLYPKELYSKQLYKKNNMFEAIYLFLMKLLFLKKYTKGILSLELKSYFNKSII